MDGSWGSGKTHFIRAFFGNQLCKPHEIYYISCFGIRTREQVEKVLVDEIEQHSTFGSLDHIPVISSLVKWAYKILGLDLMKKHSLIIFDDLERVAYSENQKDNPEDYNDLLGFIDHLANHRNQKVLVLMNKKDMVITYQKILEEKFKPIVATIPSQSRIITKLALQYSDEKFVQNFINELFLFRGERGAANLREIPRLVKRIDDIDYYDDLEVMQEQWLALLNSFEDLQEALESVFELIEDTNIIALDVFIEALVGLLDDFQSGNEDYFKSALEVIYLIEFLKFCKDEFTSLRFDSTEKKFIFY